MAKIRFQQVIQVEYDTDTGKSRVIKNFASILGQGNTAKKPIIKEIKIKSLETEELG